MSQTDIQRVLKPFEQAHIVRNARQKGTVFGPLFVRQLYAIVRWYIGR